MEEQLSPLAVTHLLQHTLRSLCGCGHDDAQQWVYAVFWRIVPRNYPPPKWDLQGGIYDRTRGNRRNWILQWEDGFCNFAASSACNHHEGAAAPVAAAYTECAAGQEAARSKGLQPEVFFKMAPDIYNYGEGLIGKVAADHSHKWVFQEAQEHETSLIASWSNPADSYPRTWEAQFKSGIKTIALIAVREGVVQLGSMNKVAEDLSYVVMLRRKFGYLESIPGVLLPHPSSAAFPAAAAVAGPAADAAACSWPPGLGVVHVPPMELYDPYAHHQAAAAAAAQMHIVPSMSSLEALLSKLPSVDPASSGGGMAAAMMASKEETGGVEHGECHRGMDDDVAAPGSAGGVAGNCGESTSVAAAAATPTTAAAAVSYYVNVAKPGEGF